MGIDYLLTPFQAIFCAAYMRLGSGAWWVRKCSPAVLCAAAGCVAQKALLSLAACTITTHPIKSWREPDALNTSSHVFSPPTAPPRTTTPPPRHRAIPHRLTSVSAFLQITLVEWRIRKTFSGSRVPAGGALLSDSGRGTEVKEPWPHKFKYSSYFQTQASCTPAVICFDGRVSHWKGPWARLFTGELGFYRRSPDVPECDWSVCW